MIGGIQLSHEGIEREPTADDRFVIGEEPGKPEDIQEDLADTALPREKVEQFMFEIRLQPHWRRESDRCADYYDGNQLSPETIDTLKERGQPPLITNLIKPTIDTVLGMEAKSRSDWRINPEDDGYCSDDLSEALSVKLKHAEQESRADRAISDAYAAQMKAGVGWVEVAKERDSFKCPYRVRYVHRREIFWDWRSEQPDLSDSRYLIRRRWLELDHAISMMPQYANLFRMTLGGWAGFDPILEQSTNLARSFMIERDSRLEASDWRDVQRQRVCLYEIWYRRWVRGMAIKTPDGKAFEADFDNTAHQEAILYGGATVSEEIYEKIRLAWYVGPHFLYDIPSPYKHRNFPYVPFFGYREDLTGVPYGLIRSMLSPQDEINARKSKMLWLLNSRRAIADSDVVEDHNKTAQELARADAYIILNNNRKPNSGIQVEDGGNLATQQFQAMQEAKSEIEESSGIHKAMQGQSSSASSGLAINSLVEQGLTTLAEINDNYRYARRVVGEMLFELVKERIGTRPARVTLGEGEQKREIILNLPQTDPETGESVIANDVSRVQAKVVLDDIPSTPTFRMQQLQNLTELTKALPPQIQGAVVDFVVEATDLPNRHKIADRIRAAAGIVDPEQRQAMQQQQAQAQAVQQDIARKMMVLEAAEKAAKIRKMNVDADKIEQEITARRFEPMLRTPQVSVTPPIINPMQ